jgi:RNA polymerase sigma-70 factor (ECF subfamily)
MGLLKSREAAEDVAQDAFCRLWERRAQLRSDGSLRGFLYHVARNMAISAHRSENVRQRALTALMMEPPTFAHIEMQYDGLSGELKRAIRSLPERRREIVVLHCIHGLTYKEIARLLGIAPQTVANQFSSALDDLRRGLRVHAMV